MPSYGYAFMMEWGDWILGTGMVLFWTFCLVTGFIFFKKLCPHFSSKSDQEDTSETSLEELTELSQMD